jgi:gamma-glutamyltranspeptidase / glutathione hydrolase
VGITRRDFIKGSAALAAVGLMSAGSAGESGRHPTDAVGHKGMVTSTDVLASRAGREILLAGGNAVDAAVATALALCVTHQSGTGLAGYGGAMVIYLAHERRVVGIDYNCRAPRAAREDMYKIAASAMADDEDFPPVVGKANFWGPQAVSVPGTVAGLSLAAHKYGKLGWAKCVHPALKLASDGFPVSPGVSDSLRSLARRADAESVHTLLPDGRVPQAGERWVQKDLAKLLEMLAADPDSFYRGDIGHKIAVRVKSAGGILTEQDMADYHCGISEPLTLDYKGVRLHASAGMGGNSCALETLAIMRKLSASRYKPGDRKYWGDFGDALTLAWHDRLRYVGDVPGIDHKIRQLISDAYASELAKIVRSGKVPKGPGGADPLKETVHLSTCDADHNVVSLTQTQGNAWGSEFGVPGLGIMIGHGMSRFDPRPGLPNSPGSWKQPLHNMSPLVLTKDGKPFGTVGLPGGRMIPSVVAGFVMDLVDFGMTPVQAISAPRIHTEGGPISYTRSLPQAALDEIRGRGHKLSRPKSIGGQASVIKIDGDRILGSAQAVDAALGI